MSKNEDAFVPHSMIPYFADGSGYYSDSILGCHKVICEAEPLVLDAIKLTSVKPGSVFTIADYGCADGGTSMPLLYACVQELRKIHGDDLPINVVYEDQPVNDFKSLFLRLQGLIQGPKSYLADFPNVFVTACGTNFYSQCLPPNSVNFGFSSTALHWMSRMPCNITGALHHSMITIPEEAEVFKKQAAKDWETILLNRAKEMASGSRMVFVQLAMDEERQCTGTTKGIPVSVHPKLCELWQGLVSDGLITQEEFHKTNFAYCMRTVDEFKEPFKSNNSPVRKAGLSLISIETKVIPCPYRESWLKNGGDPREHAHWYIPTIRVWSNTTLISGGGINVVIVVVSLNRNCIKVSLILDHLKRRKELSTSCFNDTKTRSPSALMIMGWILLVLTWSLRNVTDQKIIKK